MISILITFSVLMEATLCRRWLEKVASWVWPPDEQMAIVGL